MQRIVSESWSARWRRLHDGPALALCPRLVEPVEMVGVSGALRRAALTACYLMGTAGGQHSAHVAVASTTVATRVSKQRTLVLLVQSNQVLLPTTCLSSHVDPDSHQQPFSPRTGTPDPHSCFPIPRSTPSSSRLLNPATLLRMQERTVTYSELLASVCRIANYLKSVGVQRGDDVTLYMSLVPELPAAMVSGHVHSACMSDGTDMTSM